ncbi:unnamed protein product [Bursaphelenchus xylophilus]|uniref:(pine wood nematode) hypothetical protein n=1 Tax=Bursaphelenchus xylophilus TaxID=6326 RepID=A0A1I7RKQ0_BURXY|nr:unnamed protein product [Bursaphelenchus xylophilus]CAG9131168.1 unnamed protein product [Bursaphelenchus xylophilus]
MPVTVVEGPKSGSNRSEVWKYFTETVGGAKCKLCGQLRVRSDKSTKTMHDHLRTAHKDVSYQKAYPNRKPQRIVPNVRPPKSISESKSPVVSTAVHQTRKVELDADRHVLCLILRCMADFDAVLASPEFQSLMAASYPAYKMKSRTHYGCIVSERESNRISYPVTPKNKEFFSLTADWLASDFDNLITFSSHHLTDEYKDVSGILFSNSFGPSTSDLDVAERLRQKLREMHVDINKLVAICHNGSFVNISRLLNVNSFECGARVISRVVQRALDVECVQFMITRARNLIENYKKHSKTKTFFHDRFMRNDNNWVRVCELLTALVTNSETLNALAEELSKKETTTRLCLDDEEAELFSHLSIIMLTFREEAIRLSKDCASAYFPTFLKLKSFVDCYHHTAGGVIEVFVNTIRQELAYICEQIRVNKFLMLCTVVDPRFRNRPDCNGLDWVNLEGDFLDFALNCALKVQPQVERKEEPATHFTQMFELMINQVDNQQQDNGCLKVAPKEVKEVVAEVTKDVVASEEKMEDHKPSQKSTKPIDIWRNIPSMREENDLNFRLSFSVTLKCELDQFSKMECIERNSSLQDWWNIHSNEFPRLRRFAIILNSIPATAICSDQLFGPEATVYSSKLMKWFGHKSTANCLLIKSNMTPFKRLPLQLQPNKSEDDS